MISKFNFSILTAYRTSLRTNYKNILFYLAWYGVYFVIASILSILLSVYADVLNYFAMAENYGWIASSLKHQLVTFFWGFSYKNIKFTEFSLYGFLKIFVSEDILNPIFQTMTFKEYFNIILASHKTALVLLSMIWLVVMMTVSIGYIKTAFKFQSEKKATLHDMYQYIYLLPQYILGKIIMLLVCFAPLMIPSFIFFGLSYMHVPGQAIHFGKFAILFLIIALWLMMLVSFLYQRLRFIKYFIIDKEISAFKAMQMSWDITKNNVMSLSLFSLIVSFVAIVHPISGLFIMLTGWLNQQAEVSVYRQMNELEKK